MSNSIIDQQRDNADFFWVHNSWLPGPVKGYDHDAQFKYMQEQGAKIVYGKAESGMEVLKRLQKLHDENYKRTGKNPFYWTETVKEDE